MNQELKKQALDLFNEALERLSEKEGVTSVGITCFPDEEEWKEFCNISFHYNRNVYDVNLRIGNNTEGIDGFRKDIEGVEYAHSRQDFIGLLKESGLYEEYSTIVSGIIDNTPGCITRNLYHDPESFLEWYFDTSKDTSRIVEESFNTTVLDSKWRELSDKWNK